jgi:hypothetical protein
VSFKYKKALYIALLVIFSIAGSFIANAIYRWHVLVDGALGMAVLYLLFRAHKSVINGGTIEYLLSQSKKEMMKDFFYVFVGSFLVFLSFMLIGKLLSALFL